MSALMGGRTITAWLMDMDGVLVSEEHAIPGAAEFIGRLRELEIPFLVITNNSMYTRRDLRARLGRSGLDLPEEAIWTSALATAGFLDDQRPNGSAFVVGEAGLTTALHGHGYVITDRDPDYVVLGETRTYSFERITRAIRLVADGARFIATNPDRTCPVESGEIPDCAGMIAAVEAVTDTKVETIVGKPSPIILEVALRALGCVAHESVIVGDRVETDIAMGKQLGLATILVLSGVTRSGDPRIAALAPDHVLRSVRELIA